MKKLTFLLVIVFALSLAACGTVAGEANPTDAPTEAVSTLEIKDLSWPASGTIEDFQIKGTITSNYELGRVTCDGMINVDALDLSIKETADPYYFADDTYSADIAELSDYLVDQYGMLYDLYASAAGTVGADDSVTVKLTCTCYDASGKSESFNLEYTISGENASGLVISGLSYPHSGTVENFKIAGTLNSPDGLIKIESKGTAECADLQMSFHDVADPYLFADGVDYVDLADLNAYYREQISALYQLYADLAGVVDADDSVMVRLECTAYDAANHTVNFSIGYQITAE